jgi:hypothetical protein
MINLPIYCSKEEQLEWKHIHKDAKRTFLMRKRPFSFKRLLEQKETLKTLLRGKQDNYHFGEITAMEHFAKNGYKVTYFETGNYTDKKNWEHAHLSQYLNALQMDFLKKGRTEIGKLGGIPDLFITKGDQFFFAEVKLPTDKVKKNQQAVIGRLLQLNIPVTIINVIPE